jgi:NADH-quinone oxidoreductase subunit L
MIIRGEWIITFVLIHPKMMKVWNRVDDGLIDGWLVNGSARLVGNISARVRLWQSGYLFQYAFAMIVGLIAILAIWVALA